MKLTAKIMIEYLSKLDPETIICCRCYGNGSYEYRDAKDIKIMTLVPDPMNDGEYEEYCAHCSGVYFGKSGMSKYFGNYSTQSPGYRGADQLKEMKKEVVVIYPAIVNDYEY